MGDAADYLINSMLDREFDIDDGFTVSGHQVHATLKAVLWRRGDDSTEHWIPKSQILEQDEGSITISTWLAGEKGWQDDVKPPKPRGPKFSRYLFGDPDDESPDWGDSEIPF